MAGSVCLSGWPRGDIEWHAYARIQDNIRVPDSGFAVLCLCSCDWLGLCNAGVVCARVFVAGWTFACLTVHRNLCHWRTSTGSRAEARLTVRRTLFSSHARVPFDLFGAGMSEMMAKTLNAHLQVNNQQQSPEETSTRRSNESLLTFLGQPGETRL
jgi:hypothetical protein